MHGTEDAVGRVVGKNCAGTDVQGLAVGQVDGGLAGVGGGVAHDLGAVSDGDLASRSDDAVSGGIAGDHAVGADGNVVIRRQGGVPLDGGVAAQSDAAFDGVQLFRARNRIPVAVLVAVNGLVQVDGFRGNGGAVQDGVVSQGNIAAHSLDGDGSGRGLAKDDAAGNAVIHGIDDGFAVLGVARIKLFRGHGADSSRRGHVSVQRNFGRRIADDLAGSRHGVLHGDVVAQDHGLFVGIAVGVVGRPGIGLACRRRGGVHRVGCLAGNGDGFFHGDVVADAYLSVRGGDGGAYRLGIGGVIRSFDGNVPAVNGGGVRGVRDYDVIVASQGFAQRDVVEADLSINQIIIEINQFAAGIRHLDGNVARSGDGVQLGPLFLGQCDVIGACRHGDSDG